MKLFLFIAFCFCLTLLQSGQAILCGTKDKLISINNGVIDPALRWKSFFVHPSKSFNQTQLEMINEAVWALQAAIPCLPMGVFHPNSNPDPSWDYIKVHSNGPYCASYEVGRVGGPQEVVFADHCWEHSTLVHEFMHALGFHHEQNRPDRDEYVDIIWENIIPSLQSQFTKNFENETTTFDLPYDFRSIMHYRSFEASLNGQDTIIAKNGEAIGPSSNLTDLDIQKLRKMYNCTLI